MASTKNLNEGISEPQKVDEYLNDLNHPLKDLMVYLRKFILSVDKNIGEGIYWNAPTYFYTGSMKPFPPKEYKRYIVGFNFYKQDMIRLIFLRGATVNNKSGILSGDYQDGRRIAHFANLNDIKKQERELEKIIKGLVKLIDN